MRISDWSSDVCSSDLGLSVAQAARRLGVKTATWQGWENDRAEPRSNKLLMIAGAFGVSPTWLLGGYGDGPTEVIEDEVQILRQELKSVAQDVAAAQTRLDAVLSRLGTFQPYHPVARTLTPLAERPLNRTRVGKGKSG